MAEEEEQVEVWSTEESADRLEVSTEKDSRVSDTVDALKNLSVQNENFNAHRTAMPIAKDAEHYNMGHKKRGKCIVFNHETFDETVGFKTRKGSSVDAKRIEETFSRLGFEVDILTDCMYNEIATKIKGLSEEDHTDSDCICIFVLTHGVENDFICARDLIYKSDVIWKPFNAENCKSLAGKPKLFFFQACRGSQLDGGITLYRSLPGKKVVETDSAVASYKIPTYADFLIAHSVVKGFASLRNPEEGTWYIQCLCEVFDEHALKLDLSRMLTITARKVATDYVSYNDRDRSLHDKKQAPSVTSMLIRELYFTPK